MSPRRAAGILAVLSLSLLGLAVPGVVPSAQAVTGSPPVTASDAVSVYAGSFTVFEPLSNDTDPDGDQLAVCRFDSGQARGLLLETSEDQVGIGVRPKVEPGVYTVTYYACDFSYLTPGTVTVTVLKHPDVKVTKVPGRPGRLRVTNPADFKIRFLWGSAQASRPEGNVSVAKHSSTVITVRSEKIIWVAYNRRIGLIDQGRVSGIDVRRASAAPVTLPDVSADALKAWADR